MPTLRNGRQYGRTLAPVGRTMYEERKKLYGYDWQVYRIKFLQQRPFCAMCQEKGLSVAATIVDHIVPHNGDRILFWAASNHQPLCKPCHDGDKQRIDNANRYGHRR